MVKKNNLGKEYENPKTNQNENTTPVWVFKNSELNLEARHKVILNECKKQGEEDARRQTPAANENKIPPFEKQIIKRYQRQVEDAYTEGRQVLDDIHDRQYHTLQEQLDDFDDEKIANQIAILEKTQQNELEKELNEHNDRIKEIHNDLGLSDIKRKVNVVNKRFEGISEKYKRRESNIQLRPFWLYILLILGLGIAEVPLNYQVFQTFRETPTMTLIMSLVLVIAIPFLSHSSGKFLKQIKENSINPYLLILSIVLITVISYLTAQMRTKFLAVKGDIELESLFTEQWTFFAIGMLLFFVGLIASYFAHDSSLVFMGAYNEQKQVLKKYDEIEKQVQENEAEERQKFRDIRKGIIENYKQRITELTQKKGDLNAKINEVIGKHDKVLNYYKGLERTINEGCKISIEAYRTVNYQLRNNHAQPPYWSNPLPDLEFRFINYKELNPNPQAK